ncbi:MULTISPECIES: hypothetical protein [unclassified Frankia]|uniref:hypothetical protein n=1 Tax=unclassified Frankia TaxID=2632575 RepID=UPI001EF451FD|nr:MULTISPECIES: hypothetical protein [unclassified Frankia]
MAETPCRTTGCRHPDPTMVKRRPSAAPPVEVGTGTGTTSGLVTQLRADTHTALNGQANPASWA